MNIFKKLTLLILFLVVTGCASIGLKIVIETPEPAEDFVVICEWYGDRLFSDGHGGRTQVGQKVFVTESGEEVDCGFNMTGGDGSADILHPIYMRSGVTAKTQSSDSERITVVDGVIHLKINKTKLDLLDEQKAKFEAGYWDKSRWPESRYADSLKGICWFPHQYFEYYRQDKKVTLEHFESFYYDQIIQCYKKVLPILKKYDKSYKGVKEAEGFVKGYWEPKKWEQFYD